MPYSKRVIGRRIVVAVSLNPRELSYISSRAIGLSAAALFLIVGCSAGGTGTPLTAGQALLANARQTQKLNSVTEAITVQVNGATTTSGTAQVQRTPTFEVSEDLTVASAGKSTELKAILTGSVFYIAEPALAAHFGKPWLKLDLAGLSKGPLAFLAQIVSSVKSNDFVNQTQLLAQAKNARVIGKRTVDGVPTTEYAGSVRAAAALKALGPKVREALGPVARALGNSVLSFHIWIDAQNHTRKVTEVETINGAAVTTTVNISGINQPVHISPPPASETFTPPGG